MLCHYIHSTLWDIIHFLIQANIFDFSQPINFMDSCIFCAIIEGKIPSYSIYEDDTTLAFLDVNPLSPGHTLVVPKCHSPILNDLSPKNFISLMGTIHDLIEPIEQSVGASATTIAFNNGEAAGQEVPHVHCHIIPRFKGDQGGSIHSIMASNGNLQNVNLDAISNSIINSL